MTAASPRGNAAAAMPARSAGTPIWRLFALALLCATLASCGTLGALEESAQPESLPPPPPPPRYPPPGYLPESEIDGGEAEAMPSSRNGTGGYASVSSSEQLNGGGAPTGNRRPRAQGAGGLTASPVERPMPVASAAATSAEDICPITKAFEKAGDCERFARQLEAVGEGRHAFKPRQPMIRGQETIVRYAIQQLPTSVQQGRGTAGERQDAISSIDAELRDEILPEGEHGAVITGAIQVGRQMYACLKGDPSFTITPAECQTKDTLEDPEPVWRWGVTPTRKGTYSLTLTSGIEVLAAGGDVRRIGRFSESEQIRVVVSDEGERDDFFAWLEGWLRSPLGVLGALTALLVAIAGLFAAVRKLRQGSAGPAAKV